MFKHEFEPDLERLATVHISDDADADDKEALLLSRSPSHTNWAASHTPAGRRLLLWISSTLLFLLPGPIAARLRPNRTSTPPAPLHKTAYLDGLRGHAALAVVVFHFATAIYPSAAVAYGVDGQTSPLSLPVLRLSYSGPIGVFFVISGFALSVRPVRLMNESPRNDSQLLKSMSSSVVRRPLRLYLPTIAAILIYLVILLSGVMVWGGFYDRLDSVTYKWSQPRARDLTLAARAVTNAATAAADNGRPATVAAIFRDLVNGFKPMLLIFATPEAMEQMGHSFNGPTWTIVVELRGSLMLYLLHLGTARLRQRVRFAVAVALAVGTMTIGAWDYALFCAGFAIAMVEYELPAWEERRLTTRRARMAWNTFNALVGVAAVYCASYPDWGAERAVGYSAMARMVPRAFAAPEKRRFWQGVGGILVVYAIGRSQAVRRVLESRFYRYVGKISFALYLVHSYVLITLGASLLAALWGKTGHGAAEGAAFVLALVVSLLAAVAVADVFQRAVEGPSQALATWVQGKVTRGDED